MKGLFWHFLALLGFYRKPKVDPDGLDKNRRSWAFLMHPDTKKLLDRVEAGDTRIAKYQLIYLRTILKQIIEESP